MANQEHLDILKQGVEVWNQWRQEHPEILPDLSDFNLTEFRNADLRNINLSDTNLNRATLAFTDLSGANLQGANALSSFLLRVKFNGANVEGTAFSFSMLSEADFTNAIHINKVIINGANLSRANFSNCDLNGANFSECNLREANLSGTDLSGALLTGANLSGANLTRAKLTGCRVYASATWGIQLDEKTIQTDLIITRRDEPLITVDNLEVAQFIYLLLNNEKIRDVIDTITSKVVLILGRFTLERKRVLDALRDELRKKDYLPIVFDFDKPDHRNVTETVTTLAHLSRFIIADITDPKSIPQELAFIIPDLPSVPVQPLLHARSKENGMYEHFQSFPWVLEAHRYTTVNRLLASLREHVIEPAEKRAKELAIEKKRKLKRL